MADEKVSLHVDADWKKQAHEEKRRLAEQAAAKAKETAAPLGTSAGSIAGAPDARSGARSRAQMPPASFSTLVQSILTQALFYLGDLTTRGAEPTVNLDMAKHQIDLLGILEDKTRGNLTPDEQRVLDTVLYEARMRYVSVASQYT